MAEPRRQRRDMFSIHLVVDGINWGSNPDAYIWTTKTGGATTSETVKIYPGAMRKQVSLGGRQTTENITLTRPYGELDHGRLDKLRAACGKAKCTVAVAPLDPEGNTWGNAETYTGTLMRVTPPDVDAAATTDGAMIEVEIDLDGDTYIG